MKKILTLLTVLLASAFTALYAQHTADGLLQQIAAKLTQPRQVEAKYTITGNGGSTSGSILLSGNRFRMTSPQLITWFDGKTQWTYGVAQQEVNITEPTAEELQQVNPLLIINSFRRNYTAHIEKAPAGVKRVSLKAKSAKAGISRAVVTVSAATLMPQEIQVTMSNRRTLTIKISGVKTSASAPAASAFKFNAKAYPKAEIVDLR